MRPDRSPTIVLTLLLFGLAGGTGRATELGSDVEPAAATSPADVEVEEVPGGVVGGGDVSVTQDHVENVPGVDCDPGLCDVDGFFDRGGEPWCWQCLPDGLLYDTYLAGEKESRFKSAFVVSSEGRQYWDVILGGRVGIVRCGTDDPAWPEGWQLDMEGAAQPRLDLADQQDLEAVDFRFGIPLTWRRGRWAVKAGYYHISSHTGDEFLEQNPGYERVNYVRESTVFGTRYYFTPDWHAYGEVGYAFKTSGGAEPFEFQFGLEYEPWETHGHDGSPFAGVNVHLREEVDFGGSVNVVAGWQWRGDRTDNYWRMGFLYYNGKSLQYSFFRESEELYGLSLWYDY